VILDNRPELLASLGMRPEVPDSEVLLAAYRRWGKDCPAHLIGSFAFAIADSERGGILLARDQLGVRPLFLHQREGLLAFASTALALTGYDGIGHELDEDRLAEYLGLVMRTERSWVTGIRPLPPATALWFDASGVQEWRYWQVSDRVETRWSPSEHAEALRDALDTAVRARLDRADGVGVALSGGLDSTSVAATAAAMLGERPLFSYTSAPPAGWVAKPVRNREADESYLVTELAVRYPNLRTSFVDGRGQSFVDGYEPLFEAGASPPRNPCNTTWFHEIFRQAHRDGVDTLLTGAGGNMFFSADDPRWLVELLRHGRIGTSLREIRSWARSTGQPWHRVVRGSVLGELPALSAFRRRLFPGGREDPAKEWFTATALRVEHQASLDVSGVTAFMDERRSAALRTDAVAVLLGPAAQADFLAVEEARWGLRMTDPTTDVRVIEVCATQPAWIRRRAGMTRAGCRTAMADRLPDSIRLRQARGLQLPDWLDRLTEARPELEAELAAARENPLVGRYVDLELIEQAFHDWPAPGTEPTRQLVYRYRLAVLRSLLVARYLRWFGDHRSVRH
jgi:asparagine synthase (glutamine-hydrolysing)